MRNACWRILLAVLFGGGMSLVAASEVAEAGRISAGSRRPPRSTRHSTSRPRVHTSRRHIDRRSGRGVVRCGTPVRHSVRSTGRSLSRHRQPTRGRISTHAATARHRSYVTIGYRPNRYHSQRHVRRHHVHRRHHYVSPQYYGRSSCATGVGTFYGRSYATGRTPTVYVNHTYVPTFVESVEYYPRAISTPPVRGVALLAPTTGPDSFLQQGDAVFRRGEYDDARRLYIRALLADGNSVAAQLSYGWSLFALGRHSTSADAFRRCLRDEPNLLDGGDDPSARYGSAEDMADHRQALERHVAAFPHDAETMFLLGYVESRVGESAAAVAHLDRAVELDERDTLAYLLRDATVRKWRCETEPRP